MTKIKTQNFFEVTTTETIPASGDFDVALTSAPTYNKGYIVFDFSNPSLREVVYFHTRSGSRIYVKAENRTSPSAHAIGATAKINNVAEFSNYLSEISSSFGFVEKTGGLTVSVWGGNIRNNETSVTIADTTLTLPANQTNYIYLDLLDNTIKQTLTSVVSTTDAVQLAIIVTSAGSVSTVTVTKNDLNIFRGVDNDTIDYDENGKLRIKPGIIGSGSVSSVTSANSDASVANPTTTPVITINTGTTANKIVKLDGSARLPSVDGSQLTSMTKSQVGLSNVDNTSDVNKPISNATQTALNAKQDTLVSGSNIKTVNGQSLVGSGDITITGGSGTVTNVSSANSDISVTNPTTTPELTLNSSTTATASKIVKRDSNGNSFSNNNVNGFTTTATAAGTTTLTVASTQNQVFTGTSTQTVVLPLPSTLTNGHSFYIENDSTGLVTIQADTGSVLTILKQFTSVFIVCKDTTATTGTNGWNWFYHGAKIASGKKFTSLKTITLDGTDDTTHVLPSTSSTVARTDAGQTFQGAQVFAGDVTISSGQVSGKTVATMSTGVLTGGVVTINVDPSKFDVTAGTGIIMDWSNPASPQAIPVSWNAFTAETIPDISKPFTTVEIDSTGSIVKTSGYSTDNTADKRRSKIILNALFHPNGVSISSVINVVKPANEIGEAAIDYIYQLGPLNSGNGASANGANLQINKAAGTTTLPWINYFTDPTKPTTQTNGAVSAINFNYNYRNGSGGFVIGSLTNTITPDLYDDGTGVLATVPNNKFTIQRIYYFSQSNLYGITYGQAVYSSITEAQAAITSENPIINPLAGSGVFVTALIVKKGATALNNTADAYFSAISSLTSSGTGATQNMQSVYNNSTPNPEIITNATNGAVTYRNGAGADTLSVIDVQNSTGTITHSVLGNGWTGIGTSSPTGSFQVSATTHNPGTVSVSGTTVTGTGTEFLKTFKLGDTITTTTTSGSETKEINSITSDTVMTTVAAFTGTSSNTTYTNSNSGAQFVILPNGTIKGLGTVGNSNAAVNDWIFKGDTLNITGTQQFTAFRDQTTYNQTTGTTTAINTFAAGVRINATSTGAFTNIRGFNSFPTVVSTNTGNISTIAAFLAAPQIQAGATGTITNWKGFSFNGTNGSTTNTITNMIGFESIPTQAGGTLTNYAGFVATKPAAATNSSLLLLGTTTVPSGNYGIYNSSTDSNYLGGILGIQKTPTAGYKIDVGGSSDSIMRLLASGQANGLEMGQLTADGGSKIFTANNNYLAIGTNNSERARFVAGGNLGLGVTGPTAILHIKAGTATAGTAPIKLTSGTVNTISEAGAIEFDGSFFYLNV